MRKVKWGRVTVWPPKINASLILQLRFVILLDFKILATIMQKHEDDIPTAVHMNIFGLFQTRMSYS